MGPDQIQYIDENQAEQIMRRRHIENLQLKEHIKMQKAKLSNTTESIEHSICEKAYLVPKGWETYSNMDSVSLISEQDKYSHEMNPWRFCKVNLDIPLLTSQDPNDPMNYKIDFAFTEQMQFVNAKQAMEFKKKFPLFFPIPWNRIKGPGLSTKIEIEPKEFQIIIISHSTYFLDYELNH